MCYYSWIYWKKINFLVDFKRKRQIIACDSACVFERSRKVAPILTNTNENIRLKKKKRKKKALLTKKIIRID